MSLGNISHTSNRIKKERKARIARSQKRNDIRNMYSATQKTGLQFKEFSKEEVKQAKVDVRIRVKKEKRQLFIKVLIASAIVLSTLSYYFHFWELF